MEETGKICFVGYKKLGELARRVLARPEFCEDGILLAEASVDQVHAVVDAAVRDGREVFVAGSANAAEFRRYGEATLIEIRLRLIDYVFAVRKALTLGRRPAVATYRYARSVPLEEAAPLFDVPVELIVYDSSEDLLEQLARSGADVVVGASQVNEAAELLGKQAVFVYPGEETIADALRRAKTVVRTQQRERRNAKLIDTIIAESGEGIAAFSEGRDLLLMNPAAKALTGLTAAAARRTGLRQLVSDGEFAAVLEGDGPGRTLHLSRDGTPLELRLLKVESRGQRLGVVALLRPGAEGDESVCMEAGPALASFQDVVRLSPGMRRAVEEAGRLGGRQSFPLLLRGEYGTGKELLAQGIYTAFYREKGRYAGLNCAAVAPGGGAALLERGLDPAGLGLLVLENVWEAGEDLQACLLWVLGGRRESLFGGGGSTAVPKVVTILPAQREEAFRRRVRPDLRYLLETLTLTVPPLRERTEDLMALFVRCLNEEGGHYRADLRLERSLGVILRGYSWPGNADELRAVCRRYALGLEGGKPTLAAKKRLLIDCIGEERLYADLRARLEPEEPLEGAALSGLVEQLKEVLLYSNEQVAARLGMSRTSMWRRMQREEPK